MRFKAKYSIVLIVGTIAFTPVAVVASGDMVDDPREYFKWLLTDRMSIKYLHVKSSTTILQDVQFNQLEDCRYESEGWYDFETGGCRVNGQTSCPKSQELDRAPRFSFDGDVYRVIYNDDILGYELHGLDRHYMSSSRSYIYDLSADLRLLGLYPVPAPALINFSLSDLNGYVNGPTSLESTSAGGTPRFKITGFLAGDLTAFIEIDRESRMPSLIETKLASTGQRRVLQCTWKEYLNYGDGSTVWYPTTVRTRTWDDGIALSAEDLVEVKAVEIGQPPSPSLYSWKSLAPVDGFTVEHRYDGKRINVVEWDAETATFVAWNPIPLEVPDPSNINSAKVGAWRSWLIAANVVIIVSIVVWLVISKRRQVCPGSA